MFDIVTDPAAYPLEFETPLNRGDLERLAALYDEQAVVRGQSNEIYFGAAAVRAEMQQLISARANITNTLRHILRYGDTALIIVDYVLRLTTPDGGPVSVTGTATNVIRHQPERGWRMIVANPQGAA
jgi:ketosteroid isomerase-like protein